LILVALANFMRLSLLKAARAVVSSAARQEIRVRFPFVISTGAQRSGEISVWMLLLGNVFAENPTSAPFLQARQECYPSN
jgi:hypothetical protein